jgi:hypothetical protein
MKKFKIWSFYTILDTQTCKQSFKADLKSSGALIGWHLKNRIIFEKCAFFLADTVGYSAYEMEVREENGYQSQCGAPPPQ